MTNKFWGTAALIGAPAMFLGTLAEGVFPLLSQSWFTSVWGTVYITAFMCSIAGIKQSGMLGRSRLAIAMPYIMLATLSVANVSNFIALVAKNKPSFFMALDLCWPLSHVLMLVVGVLAMREANGVGPRRFIPLAVGLWLPFALTVLAVAGRTQTGFFIGGLYNVVALVLLAIMVRNAPDQHTAGAVHTQLRPAL